LYFKKLFIYSAIQQQVCNKLSVSVSDKFSVLSIQQR